MSDLRDPALYFNRELSWLAFNARVLEAARDPETPLMERLKFLAITGSNLDEFFMVRVAGLEQQVAAHVEEAGPDGLPPAAQLKEIAKRAQAQVDLQYSIFRDHLVPALRQAGLQLLRPAAFEPADQDAIRRHFHEQIFPVLTPLAVDPGHPFPNLRNRSLNLVVRFQRKPRRTASRGVVQVPAVLARFVPLARGPAGEPRFAWLEDVIAMHVDALFPGAQRLACHPFRVTRNWDLSYDEEEADDLLKMVETSVRRRERGNAVRLEIDADADESVREQLVEALRLRAESVYAIRGPLHLADLMSLYQERDLGQAGRLREEPLVPAIPAPLRDGRAIFPAIGRGDLLLHHPYESFDPVVDFVEQAAADPDVLAIKQTLYRTSGDSPIVRALTRAAENRKQVTAIVEIKARFDEENNIAWARALEESGVHVVYGLVGLKTHCKMSLVVRREGGGIARYLHLSTGNYNPSTARVYTDLSYFTANPALAADATTLFNLLTGGSVAEAAWQRFAVSPGELKETLLLRIEEVARAARDGKPARIEAKMNALVDGDTIRALYAASQAGATVELLVRGICCLRPGVPGVSERIRVRGVVDRFLEHSRIFRFVAGDQDRVYLSSADWMPRNFQRRVELMFPVDDPAIRRRVCDEILGRLGAADARAWELQPDGSYRRVPGDGGGFRPQARFLAIAQQQSTRLSPTTAPAPSPSGGLRALTTRRRFGTG